MCELVCFLGRSLAMLAEDVALRPKDPVRNPYHVGSAVSNELWEIRQLRGHNWYSHCGRNQNTLKSSAHMNRPLRETTAPDWLTSAVWSFGIGSASTIYHRKTNFNNIFNMEIVIFRLWYRRIVICGFLGCFELLEWVMTKNWQPQKLLRWQFKCTSNASSRIAKIHFDAAVLQQLCRVTYCRERSWPLTRLSRLPLLLFILSSWPFRKFENILVWSSSECSTPNDPENH